MIIPTSIPPIIPNHTLHDVPCTCWYIWSITNPWRLLPHQRRWSAFHRSSRYAWYQRCPSSRWHRVHRRTKSKRRVLQRLVLLFWVAVSHGGSWVRCEDTPCRWCTVLSDTCEGSWRWTTCGARIGRLVGSCFACGPTKSPKDEWLRPRWTVWLEKPGGGCSTFIIMLWSWI